MKLCKDCKHFGGSTFVNRIISPFAQIFAKCHHPMSIQRNPGSIAVSGRGDGGYYCTTMRNSYTECKASAELFEPKETK